MAPARSPARRLLVALVGCASVLAAACAPSDPAPSADPPGAPADPPATPSVPADPGPGPAGELLARTEVPVPPELGDARAWHVAYRMPGVGGAPVVATGLVVAPDAPSAAPRPVLVWGHPTRGSADACAPARDGPEGIAGIEAWLGAGLAVVAPDLEGLGGPGPHPYLVGPSEGRSLLWAVVAARDLPEAGVTAASPVALWGFSQGGHAAAFAAQMAPEEVPDLDLRGVALAAPVSDVTSFARRAEGRDDQVGVLVAIVGGQLAATPSLDPAAVLTEGAVARLGELEDRCIGEVVADFAGPVGDTSARPVDQDPAWRAALDDDRAGQAPVAAPVLVVQGDADDIVDPADTEALVGAWCARGTDVTAVVRPGGDHGTPAEPVVVPWLLDRLEGHPTTGTCGESPRLVSTTE